MKYWCWAELKCSSNVAVVSLYVTPHREQPLVLIRSGSGCGPHNMSRKSWSMKTCPRLAMGATTSSLTFRVVEKLFFKMAMKDKNYIFQRHSKSRLFKQYFPENNHLPFIKWWWEISRNWSRGRLLGLDRWRGSPLRLNKADTDGGNCFCPHHLDQLLWRNVWLAGEEASWGPLGRSTIATYRPVDDQFDECMSETRPDRFWLSSKNDKNTWVIQII